MKEKLEKEAREFLEKTVKEAKKVAIIRKVPCERVFLRGMKRISQSVAVSYWGGVDEPYHYWINTYTLMCREKPGGLYECAIMRDTNEYIYDWERGKVEEGESESAMICFEAIKEKDFQPQDLDKAFEYFEPFEHVNEKIYEFLFDTLDNITDETKMYISDEGVVFENIFALQDDFNPLYPHPLIRHEKYFGGRLLPDEEFKRRRAADFIEAEYVMQAFPQWLAKIIRKLEE